MLYQCVYNNETEFNTTSIQEMMFLKGFGMYI